MAIICITENDTKCYVVTFEKKGLIRVQKF